MIGASVLRLPWLTRVRQSRFARHAMWLGIGTAAAQVIAFGAAPLIARLYTPEMVGLFGVYLAAAALLGNIATCQYETVLMLPRRQAHARELLRFALVVTAVGAVLISLPIILLREPLAALLREPRLAVWCWSLPFSVVLLGWSQLLRFYAMRAQAFSEVGWNTALRALVGGGLACLMGVWPPVAEAPEFGLIVGQIAADTFGGLLLMRGMRRREAGVFGRGGALRPLAVARRWRNLALTMTVNRTIGAGYARLPIVAIGAMFGPAAAGLYLWADRFAVLPSQLISDAIGDVYRQQATQDYHTHGRFDRLTRQTLVAAMSLAIVPFALGIWFAPELFAWLFGETWRPAGEYAAILMVGGFVSFVTAPIDKATLICERGKFILAWQLSRLGGKAVAVLLTAAFGWSIETLLWMIVGVRITLYAVNVVYSYRLSLGNVTRTNRQAGLPLDRQVIADVAEPAQR